MLRYLIMAFAMSTSLVAEARFATKDESQALDLNNHYSIHVNDDGTYDMTIEIWRKVTRDHARTSVGTQVIHYDADTTKVRIVQAETVNGEQVTAVPDDMIEDKPVAGNVMGFDENRQIKIAFQQVEVGSKVHLVYEQHVKKVPFQGIFAERYLFGRPYWEEGTVFDIESELPLKLALNDPRRKLSVNDSGFRGGVQKIRVDLVQPLSEDLFDEEDSLADVKNRTWFQVSTEKDYSGFIARIVDDYEAVASQNLPAIYERILNDVKQSDGDPEQRLNKLAASIIDNIRYMGDWRTVRGGYIPRPLDVVSATQMGDCKDFATAAVAIARRLGYEAHVAIIYRGMQFQGLPELPMNFSNHAIAHIKVGGREFWVDPTNQTSYAGGIYSDLLNRPAMILDKKEPRLVWTPKGDPKTNVVKFLSSLRFDGALDAAIDVRASWMGAAAVPFAGIELAYSRDALDTYFVKGVADRHPVLASKVWPYDLKSRIVKNFDLRLQIRLANMAVPTSMGRGYTLESKAFSALKVVDPEQRVTGIFLDRPQMHVNVETIEDATMRGRSSLDCEADSDWLRVTRKVKQAGHAVVIESTQVVKTQAIPLAELKSPKFKEFQKQLNTCLNTAVVEFAGGSAVAH